MKSQHEIEDLDFTGKTERQVKISLELKSIAQDFFQKESSKISLITVTKVSITKDFKRVDIYITILPTNKEEEALSFAKRLRSDLRTEIKNKLKIRTIPFVEIKIDEGDKIRQRINDLLHKK